MKHPKKLNFATLENQLHKSIIIIGGPTASGKTALSVEIANYFKTEIISTDSRQFYNELEIGVARPEKEYLETIPHHFIAAYSVFDPIDAYTYAVQAENKIHEILAKKNEVILTGGSGFYIKALMNGLDEMPKKNQELRDELNLLFQTNGIAYLQNILLNKNKEIYEKTDIKNPQRLIRAIEISNSSFDNTQNKEPKNWDYSIYKFYINPEREFLYQNINKRVDEMMENGLENEVKNLILYKDLPALKTVGYSELFDYLDGKLSKEEAIDKIKQHTRNYAKRQITWFKNQEDYLPINGNLIDMKLKIINTIKNGK